MRVLSKCLSNRACQKHKFVYNRDDSFYYKCLIIMDVLKDFELRQVGSRLVLRQICPPDFEMRTIIAADKIVEQKEDFFVLGYNENFSVYAAMISKTDAFVQK